MSTVITVFGFAIIAVCAWGMAAPKPMMDMVSRFLDRPWGIYLAIAGRLGLGIVCLLGADSTRYPGVFSLLGYLMIFAAVVIAVMGAARLKKMLGWWLDRPANIARAWLVLGAAFGVFLVHAAS